MGGKQAAQSPDHLGREAGEIPSRRTDPSKHYNPLLVPCPNAELLPAAETWLISHQWMKAGAVLKNTQGSSHGAHRTGSLFLLEHNQALTRKATINRVPESNKTTSSFLGPITDTVLWEKLFT